MLQQAMSLIRTASGSSSPPPSSTTTPTSPPEVTFNPALAQAHSYLGATESVSGRTFLPVGARVELPVFPLAGVVLMPGETLPMRVFSRGHVNTLRHLLGERGQRPLEPSSSSSSSTTPPGAEGSSDAAAAEGRAGGRTEGEAHLNGGEEKMDSVSATAATTQSTTTTTTSPRPMHDDACDGDGDTTRLLTFGVVSICGRTRGGTRHVISRTGTTAEIRSRRGGDHGEEEMSVVALGRQRFELEEWVDEGGEAGGRGQGQGQGRGTARFARVRILQDTGTAPPVPPEVLLKVAGGRGREADGRGRCGYDGCGDGCDGCGGCGEEGADGAGRIEGAAKAADWVEEEAGGEAAEGTGAGQSISDGEGATGVFVDGGNAKRRPRLPRRGVPGTYWPRWVYAQLDGEELVRRARRLLFGGSDGDDGRTRDGNEDGDGDENGDGNGNGNGSNGSGSGDPVPPNAPPASAAGCFAALRERAPPPGCTPDEFSFWLAANLPLGDRERLQLLEASSAVERIRLAIDHLERLSMICCRVCGNEISHVRHLFSMSSAGVMGTYVNPGGYIHQMTTTLEAEGLLTNGDEPCSQDSWFPGYAWTIIGCEQCSSHLGWRFDAEEVSGRVRRVAPRR